MTAFCLVVMLFSLLLTAVAAQHQSFTVKLRPHIPAQQLLHNQRRHVTANTHITALSEVEATALKNDARVVSIDLLPNHAKLALNHLIKGAESFHALVLHDEAQELPLLRGGWVKRVRDSGVPGLTVLATRFGCCFLCT